MENIAENNSSGGSGVASGESENKDDRRGVKQELADALMPEDHQETVLSIMAIAGLCFIFGSVLSLVFMFVCLYFIKGAPEVPADAAGWIHVKPYMPSLICLIATMFCAGFGFLLMRAAGAANREVIPRADAELIGQMLVGKNQEGVDNYIKLSSLSGIVGLFTKLGLYGLPLATIFLTIFFCIAAFFEGSKTDMLDLAKLTLGAFIGSFVQRSRQDATRPSEA